MTKKRVICQYLTKIRDGHFVLMVLICLVLRSVGKGHEIIMTAANIISSLVLECFIEPFL